MTSPSTLDFAQADVICMISSLRAYLDEFDDYKNEECVCFGIQGLIGPVPAWHKLQCQWEDALECSGINAFHATDMNASEGAFRGWTKYQKERLTSQLVGIIQTNSSDFRLLGSGVVMSSFNYLPEYRRRHLRNPYFSAALSIMLDATRFSHFEYGDKPVEFVFDQKTKHRQWIDQAYDGIVATRYGYLCAAKSMANHRSVSPLQVADFIAYEAEKYIEGRFRNPGDQDLPPEKLRWPVQQLRGLFMASDTSLHTWHSLMLMTDFWGNYKRLCKLVLRTKITERYEERRTRLLELRAHYATTRNHEE